MKTIVLTGGGTAGHCTPHFALLEGLEKHFDKIYYIGSETGIEKRLVTEKGIPYYEIPTVKLKRSLTLSNLKIPFMLLKSINSAKKILKELKPSVVFSKGGFVGLPVTIASKKLNIPVIIHESDLSLGLANKIASKFSSATLTTFSSTAKGVKNGLCVGSPVRKELFLGDREKAIEKYGFSKEKPTLLIVGGSSGAKAINDLTFNIVAELTKKFNVLHIVGKNNLSPISLKGYYQTEFADMSKAYAVADICVSRAGSNTLFELLALKIPSLIIPLPKGESRGDQVENAEFFYKKGLINYLPQEKLSSKVFANEIFKLYSEKNFLLSKLNKENIEIGNDKIIDILTKY